MSDVKIRAARASDYQDMYEVLNCPGVVRNTMQLPHVSLDHRKRWMEGLSENDYMLVAEVNGRVVGNIDITRHRNRASHSGHLGMAVHDDFQNQGIGSALMDAMLDMAFNWLNLKRVELQVYTDNERAIHLYKKFGFEIEGTHRMLAFRDGEYIDAYTMACIRE
jgi:putative acetyltransferase